jgi:Flp pilus assembly pilin Flp
VVQALVTSRTRERGQALVEYALVVALVGACLVAILGLVGRATHNAYERTTSAVSRGASTGYSAGSGGILTSTAPGGRPRIDPPPEPAADSADADDSGGVMVQISQ